MSPDGGRDETDVLVIGAGLIGAATAYYLSREGVECLVVDRGEVNREGSGASAGSLHIQIRKPERAYADETLRQFILMKVAAGQIWAKRIVNAAGPWAGSLAAMVGAPLPVGGRVIQAGVTERREPILDQLIQHVRPALSLKQTTYGTFIIGGGWPAMTDPQTGRPVIDPACVAGNFGVALRVLPTLHDVQVVRTWLGVIAHSEDLDGQRLQIFGELPSVPGYYVIAGGTLFTMGPLFSRLAAELMTTGKTSYPVDIFHPERFGRALGVPRLQPVSVGSECSRPRRDRAAGRRLGATRYHGRGATVRKAE